MKIIAKLGVLTLLATVGVNTSFATTINLYGKLTNKSAYAMNDTFVRNAGLSENVDPEKADVILAQIADVDPNDAPALQAALNTWIESYKIECFKMTIARAESSKDKIVLLGEHVLDEAHCIKGQITDVVESTVTPSGHKYTTYLTRRGEFVPIIMVGVKGNRPPHKAAWMINKRLQDDNLIYPAPHFQVDIESLHIDSK